MIINFGLWLDEESRQRKDSLSGNILSLGPKGLLYLLESRMGLAGYANDNEYLRIEAYRQALKIFLEREPHAFFKNSFDADQFATAAELLSRRDELKINGLAFTPTADTPERIQVICQIEQHFATASDGISKPKALPFGFADRFCQVLEKIESHQLGIDRVELKEPSSLLPFYLHRLFDLLRSTGKTDIVEVTPYMAPPAVTDLQRFQHYLSGESRSVTTLENDGSLLLVRAKRLVDASVFLSKLMRKNEHFKPLCLLPEMNRQLDNAFIQEGLPSLGILSASLARPSLQILKLIPAFLWEPIDPFKILEFTSLTLKPLADDLALVIARQMAASPGLNSESWYIAINQYFDDLKVRSLKRKDQEFSRIRKQYDFWFERRRYPVQGTVPKKDVLVLYGYLKEWAFEMFSETGERNPSLLVLGEQARRIEELLAELPEQQLSYLELERIVRTIYQPSPVSFKPEELGHLLFVYHPGAVTDTFDQLLWWNFSEKETTRFFSRWYQHEMVWLRAKGIVLDTPADETSRLWFAYQKPIRSARSRLVLVLPDSVDGTKVYPHPVFSDLLACFKTLNPVTLDVDDTSTYQRWSSHFQLPERNALHPHHLSKPLAFITIQRPDLLCERETETFTGLETLIYYPYQWVFRHQIKLVKSSILSVVKQHTLLGNLGHRLFERLLRQNIYQWSKSDLDQWIAEKMPGLLSKEGAVLLLYGYENERVAFENKIKMAAWTLVSLLQKNGWKVMQTEMNLEGSLEDVRIKGIADIVLQRGEEQAILDLKWRGYTYREALIRNEEDLQLVLYAVLLGGTTANVHTAYFILEAAKMVSRSNRAFREVIPISPNTDPAAVNQRIFEKMKATYQWRQRQLQKGFVEVRTEKTELQLEDLYLQEGVDLMELLEMKSKDAPFDDYAVLIHSID